MTDCDVCREARRFARTSEPFESAVATLTALEGKTVTPEVVAEFVEAVRLAEEEALRAWLEVERLDDEENYLDQTDKEETDVRPSRR